MADKIKIRDVGLREIYDSYMGILRISPDKDMNDDITDALLAGTEVELSDSDGNPLSLTFIGKKSVTSVLPLDESGEKRMVNLVNMVSRVKDILFAAESVNVRSTLYFGRNAGETKNNTNILVVSGSDTSKDGTRNLLMYPTDSPYTSEYWNDLEKIVKHDDISKYYGEYDDQLAEFLYNRDASWYKDNGFADNAENEKHLVKINNKTVYITNYKDELIPVLYDKCCVLGHRKDATGRLTQSLIDTYTDELFYGFKNIKTIGSTVAPYISPDRSYITRLSFFDVDKMIWEGVTEVTSGNIRHRSPGRYEQLGANASTNLKNEMFHLKPNPAADAKDYSIAANNSRAYSFVDTAPLLGTDVAPGLIIYNAMPMKKFAYSALRQIALNNQMGYISTPEFKNNQNTKNVSNIFGDMITPAGSGEKTSSIRLVKNFIICDGQSISDTNYKNHPHVDGKNKALAELMTPGITPQDTIYSVIKTINLLDWNSTSGRYLRGQMWNFADDQEDSGANVVQVKQLNSDTRKGESGHVGDAGDNGHKVEVVEMQSGYNPYSTRKNFTNCEKPYMINYDSRIQRTQHQHHMFSSIYGKYTKPDIVTDYRTGFLGMKIPSGKTTSKYTIAGQAYCRKAPWWMRRQGKHKP